MCTNKSCSNWRFADKIDKKSLKCHCGSFWDRTYLPKEWLCFLPPDDKAAEPEQFDISSNMEVDAGEPDAIDQDAKKLQNQEELEKAETAINMLQSFK